MDSSTETVVRVTNVEYEGWSRGRRKLTAADHRPTNVMKIMESLFDAFYDDNQGLGDPAWWYEEEEVDDDDNLCDDGGEGDGALDDGFDANGAALGDDAYTDPQGASNHIPEEWGEDDQADADDFGYEEGGRDTDVEAEDEEQ